MLHFLVPVAPEDYVNGSYKVAFIPESTTAELQVPIVDDTVCEDEEIVFGNLIIATALVAVGVMVGPQNTTIISIQDDDGKWLHTTLHTPCTNVSM